MLFTHNNYACENSLPLVHCTQARSSVLQPLSRTEVLHSTRSKFSSISHPSIVTLRFAMSTRLKDIIMHEYESLT